MLNLGLDPRVWPGVLILLGLLLVARLLRSRIFSIVLVGLLFFHVAFFRDIAPKIPAGDNVLSPASGRITLIDTVREERFLKEDAWRIRIFLALWNVHVTRSPMNGAIVYQRHEMGQHLNVLLKGATQYNESNWIGIQKNGRRVLVRQMAGAIARRIVSDVTVNETVGRGGKLGVICYGSTVELFIPKKSFNPTAKVGKRVKTGKTVLGDWTEALK